MQKYITDTHCHTSEVSCCGSIPAKELVNEYKKSGYSTVIITDHFSKWTFENHKFTGWTDMVDYYLTGYRAAKKAAKDDLTILLGMELTFYENDNDYLIYGVTEEFLYNNPDLMDMGLYDFYDLARESGLLVFQAHPFRHRMTIMNPQKLDGIEVYNGNMRHDSRNDIANAWADKFGLLKVGGSDFHEYEDSARGGLITDEKITDNDMLKKYLLGGVTLKKTED